jgi:hypothetical protein
VALVKTDVLEERQFLQEPHNITSQKTAFFKNIYRSHAMPMVIIHNHLLYKENVNVHSV